MLKNLARMKHALTEWAIKESMLDDATFFTQKEWNDRGEKLHNDALLVLVIDGSGLFGLLNSCRALAYAAYHIDHPEVQQLLLFTLIEKQHQLTAMLDAEYKEAKGNNIVNMNILGL